MADGTVSLSVANYTSVEIELLWVAEDGDEERSLREGFTTETKWLQAWCDTNGVEYNS